MKQLLKLTPKGKFFFGGDRTFASERQSYFAHSEYFPQQTALLGMLRYAILKKEGALEKDNAKKEELIGYDFNLRENNFQKIKSLSPIFILEDKISWIPAGKDWQLYKEKDEHNKETEVIVNLQFQQDNGKLPLAKFDHKKEFEMLLTPFINGSSNGEQSKNMSHFFQPQQQVGNEKARDGKSKDDAFYKHDLLSFKRDVDTYQNKFAFAIWVETDNYSLKDLGTVFLGRESEFKVEVIDDVENVFEKIGTESTDSTASDKIVLLSNAFIEDLEKFRSEANFVLSGSPVPFKFILSDKNNKYYSMPKDNTRCSSQYYLLERGTVIYPKNFNNIITLLNNQAFHTIGYNHYRILKRQ